MRGMAVAGHVREHRSLLAAAEKRLLIRIAERLPAWVQSDHLTVLGLIALAVAGLGYWASRWHEEMLLCVVVALGVNWFGDSLDGTLARVRNRQRPRYGFYVDHFLDVLGALFLFGGMSLSGHMSPLVALGVLIAYLMLMAESFLTTAVRGVFRLSSFGFGPTELRIILMIGSLYLLKNSVVHFGPLGSFLLFDVGGIVAMSAMGAVFLVSGTRNMLDLRREERLPE